MDHKHKLALVTGGSRGIGAAVARKLSSEGLRVVLLGRDRAALDAVAKSIGAVYAVACDLTDAAATDAALEEVQGRVGPIDVLVNNAGIAESEKLAKTTDEAFARIMAINVTPVFRLCRALIPPMAKARWGRVINVASNAGLTGYAYTSAYCASKHAVVGLTRAIAAEFSSTGVTINAVCPGFVDTQMSLETVERIAERTKRDLASARTALEALSPQCRLMTVEEVAHVVFSLIPHEARGVHGQAIALDGGQVLA